MAFAMEWRKPAPTVPAGQLPASPEKTIYVDLNAATQGIGTQVSPYNDLPGLSIGDQRVTPGTHIIVRGTQRGDSSYVARLYRGGTDGKPVVYIGNNPAWGVATFDGSEMLTPTACASQAEAFGNTNWANLRKSTISTGLTDADLGCYHGPDLQEVYLSRWPSMPHGEPSVPNNGYLLPMTNFVDLRWYPGINTEDPVYDMTLSRPRILIADAEAQEEIRQGLPAGTLAGVLSAACDSNANPVLRLRVYPNIWYTSNLVRVDADGNPDPLGAYLLATKQITASSSSNPTASYAISGFQYCILNLPQMIDKPNECAISPAGKIIDWPATPGETLHRGTGKKGVQIESSYIWLHGCRFGGMAKNHTVTKSAVASGTTIRFQRNTMLPYNTMDGRGDLAIQLAGASIDYNYMRYMLSGSFTYLYSNGNYRYNITDNVDGSNFRCTGGHVSNVTVGGNLIKNCLSIHGNGITTYGSFYNSEIIYNVTRNVARPWTTETNEDNPTYDPQYGVPLLSLRKNRFATSSHSAAQWCFMMQGGANIGLELIDNIADGRHNNLGYYCSNGLVPGAVTASGNIAIGIKGGSAPTFMTEADGNFAYSTSDSATAATRAALIEEWDALGETIDPEYAPHGVGPTAGGWNGLG